jgi:hypothetical protein
MGKAQEIIEEAEFVATELFGERMTPRMQQMMVKTNAVSVRDLGYCEYQAALTGDKIAWGNDEYGPRSPEEVFCSLVMSK